LPLGELEPLDELSGESRGGLEPLDELLDGLLPRGVPLGERLPADRAVGEGVVGDALAAAGRAPALVAEVGALVATLRPLAAAARYDKRRTAHAGGAERGEPAAAAPPAPPTEAPGVAPVVPSAEPATPRAPGGLVSGVAMAGGAGEAAPPPLDRAEPRCQAADGEGGLEGTSSQSESVPLPGRSRRVSSPRGVVAAAAAAGGGAASTPAGE
jgi:hypothetical protein